MTHNETFDPASATLLRLPGMSGKARLAGVIGWPVGHSLSPRVHGTWLERHRIDGAYVPLPVKPEDFEQALRTLPKLGFAGANVTVPHKEAAFRLCDRVTHRARRVHAVNTLIFHADGSIEGDNTDGFGFIENVLHGAPGWMPTSGPVMLLGAGGAARGLAAALLDAGAPRVLIANRTRARAEEVARDIGEGIEVVDWGDRAKVLGEVALLVNTTTLGLHGQPPLDIALDELPGTAVVTDIVYAPLITDLLVRAQARGLRTVDGLGMLLHQARPGFAAWFGVDPRVDDVLRTTVLRARGGA